MKTIIILAICFISLGLSAQQPLDTLYANELKNVALFFPEPVRQGITGAAHFVFTYNRETQQHFGLLQAQPGPDSNLLVVTTNGQVYSYILKYRPDLTQHNYFFTEQESIGNETPKMDDIDKKKQKVDSLGRTMDYLKRASESVLKSASEKVALIREKDLYLKLFQPVYYGSEVFLKMEVKNASGVDFEIDYLNMYTLNGTDRRQSSFQSLPLNTIYAHNLPKLFKKGQSRQFVYVLPKFVLAASEKLAIELRELNGGRTLVLQSNL